MGQIKVQKDLSGIKGLCLITPAVHGDSRGYFMETYSQRDMEEAGLDINFVQECFLEAFYYSYYVKYISIIVEMENNSNFY